MPGSICWAVLAFLVATTGCVPSVIKAEYAAFNECSEKEVKVVLTNSDSYWVSGCRRPAEYFCSDRKHCATPRFVVARRHARQFGCAVGEVDVRTLEGGAWLADGCGQTVTYQCFAAGPYDPLSGPYDPLSGPAVRCIAETTEVLR